MADFRATGLSQGQHPTYNLGVIHNRLDGNNDNFSKTLNRKKKMARIISHFYMLGDVAGIAAALKLLFTFDHLDVKSMISLIFLCAYGPLRLYKLWLDIKGKKVEIDRKEFELHVEKEEYRSKSKVISK